jgi:hypothetical protein
MGAAVTLAAQREALRQVAGVMMMFGLGAAFPLLLIGNLSREALLSWRGRLATAGQTGKYILGAALLAIGAAILTGVDKTLEAALVQASPAWLTDLTTRFQKPPHPELWREVYPSSNPCEVDLGADLIAISRHRAGLRTLYQLRRRK